MKNLLKTVCLLAIFCLTGCSKNDPTCMPYEGIVLLEKNPCFVNRTMLQLVNKRVSSIYYNGSDTIQNVVGAMFPDTAVLKKGQKLYFDYEILEGPIEVCFDLSAKPDIQVKITRLSYKACSIN